MEITRNDFCIDKETLVLKQGAIIALHAGLPHSVKALKEQVFLLTLTTMLEV